MKRINQILLALDLHEDLSDILAEATALALAFGAEITLLHAVSKRSDRDWDPGLAAYQSRERCGELRRRLQESGVQVSYDIILDFAEPEDLILRSAQVLLPDLIVLGAKEKSTRDRLLRGATAERVTREATAPVWLVRPGRTSAPLRAIACAVDASHPDAEALSGALFLTKALGARLDIVSVVNRLDDLGDPRRFEAPMGRFDLRTVEVDFHLAFGKTAQEIVRFAKGSGCDLLVVGSAGRTGLERILNENTAERILRRTPCGLLVIPTGRALSALALEEPCRP